MTRWARLCPPTLHNEQSSCRGIASLGALSHLPEGYGRALLLLDSTWQVALLMTSNPIIEHGGRSSRISLQFGSEQSREASAAKSLRKVRASIARPFRSWGVRAPLVLQTRGICHIM